MCGVWRETSEAESKLLLARVSGRFLTAAADRTLSRECHQSRAHARDRAGAALDQDVVDRAVWGAMRALRMESAPNGQGTARVGSHRRGLLEQPPLEPAAALPELPLAYGYPRCPQHWQ